MHYVEVDQSGKVEDTHLDTALAFSNDISYAILIPAQVKRECIRILREKGRGGPTLYPLLFATALYFLLKDYIDVIALAVVDIEYQSKEKYIKQHFLNLLKRAGYAFSRKQIVFQRIGKRSSAHKRAIGVLRGKRKPDKVLQLEELLDQL